MTGTESTEQATLAGSAAEDAATSAAAAARTVAGDGGGEAELVDPSARRYPDADGTLELAVTQVDYTIAGTGTDETPIIHVFGRTAEGEAEHVRVHGFRPYFYAPTANLTGEFDHDRITGAEESDETGEPYESIRGEQLTKIFGQTPRDVGQIRERFDHYEADILFPNRFLIDKDIGSGMRVPERRASDDALVVPHEEVEAVEMEAKARVCTFDIEVDDRSGFPEDGEETVICLSSHDSRTDEYAVWLYEASEGIGPDDLDGYEGIEEDIDATVHRFSTEEAMLAGFLEYIEETDPDIVTGWNCLPAESEIQMADGTVREIEDIEVGDEIVGSEDQQSTVGTVTNKWESEKQIHEFELADGTTFRSSGDHRVMVGDDDSVDWKQAEEIQSGDYVLKPRKLRVTDPSVPTLDDLVPAVNQRLPDDEAVTEFKGRLPHGAVTELADEFGLSAGTLYHPKPDVWTPERCETAAQRYDIALPDGGQVYRRTGRVLHRELTPHELYLAGLVLTDGTMSEEGGVRFYNTREELHEQFPGDNALTADGKGSYKQNVLDHALLYAFNGLGIPFGDKNAVPVDLSPVYGMPEQFIARFLAGVIDGDGSVGSSLVVAAENRSIGEWYVRLFKRLGIFAQQRGRLVRVPNSERDVERLRKHVLPHMNHSAKRASVRELDGGTSSQVENIPYALFEAAVGSDAKRIGNDKHRRGINLKRHETSVEEWEEHVFVEVEDTDVAGTETTYDIETSTHDFIADDCLVHNCDDFDAPYLVDRLERLNTSSDFDLDYNRLSRVDEVWTGGWGGPNLKGRVLFDLLYAYQRTQFSELDSYRLDAVGEVELDAGKERYPGDIGDLWEDDPERLLEYNLRDVELCVEIDRQQGVIPFWQEVAAFVGCKLEDATTPGDAVDMYVLHEAHGKFALPSKGQQETEDFEGGAVFDPITGVRENVAVLDLASLYPMSMVTINASPETKVDADYDGETYRAPNGQRFRKQPDGIMREMVDDLLTERDEKKSLRSDHDPGSEAYERYDRQQQSVKVIMNSLYGVSGWDRFRLYDKENAAAITATGRRVIEFTETATNELDREVVYGDTDSVMLEFAGDMTKEAVIEQSFDVAEHINGRYDEFAREELGADEHRFEIEFEKLYRRFFQAGKKKRYAGHLVWNEGVDVDSIDITGFEYKRSDIAPITRRVQREVIERIVRGEDLSEVKTYVRGVIERFEDGEVDVEDVGIPGGIGKRLGNYDTDTAQVRGAKYANLLLGTNFQRGSKPKRLYLDRVDDRFFQRIESDRPDISEDDRYREFKRDVSNGDGVICFEYADQVPDEFVVDWPKMLDKTLKGPIARVLEALDISWNEVKSGQTQTGLGSFT